MEQKRLQIADDVERLTLQAKGAQKEIAEDAKNSAKSAATDVKGAVQGLREDAKSIVSNARQDTTDTAKQKARSAAQAADPRKVVREQPMAALAAGVGIGVLVSLVLLPRRKRYEFRSFPVQPGRYAVEHRYEPTRNDLP
jgi:ElaB/YqjD/DUF883 family membrane-anchored ribosome-binding protein